MCSCLVLVCVRAFVQMNDLRGGSITGRLKLISASATTTTPAYVFTLIFCAVLFFFSRYDEEDADLDVWRKLSEKCGFEFGVRWVVSELACNFSKCCVWTL